MFEKMSKKANHTNDNRIIIAHSDTEKVLELTRIKNK
jgi:hypothetical protein